MARRYGLVCKPALFLVGETGAVIQSHDNIDKAVLDALAARVAERLGTPPMTLAGDETPRLPAGLRRPLSGRPVASRPPLHLVPTCPPKRGNTMSTLPREDSHSGAPSAGVRCTRLGALARYCSALLAMTSSVLLAHPGSHAAETHLPLIREKANGGMVDSGIRYVPNAEEAWDPWDVNWGC